MRPPTEAVEQRTRPSWLRWFSDVGRLVGTLDDSGTTANRPTKGLFTGRVFFDTTLGYPIWYDGSGWVDATGASV